VEGTFLAITLVIMLYVVVIAMLQKGRPKRQRCRSERLHVEPERNIAGHPYWTWRWKLPTVQSTQQKSV
jgi:hypothetical protein